MKEYGMKRNFGWFFGFAVMVTAAIFTMAGCDTGTSPGAGLPAADPAKLEFSLSGNFGGGGGGHFSLGTSEEVLLSMSSMRAITADSYTLNGVLEDDDVLIRLRGSYDPYNGNWSVSARSSDDAGDEVVYTIDGSVDEAGGFLGAGVTIAARPSSDTEWDPSFSRVTEDTWSPTEEEIAESATGGMPSFTHGYWSAAWETPVPGGMGGEKVFSSLRCLISDWKIKVTGTETYSYAPGSSTPLDKNQTIIEVTQAADGSYEVISCYPEYEQDAENFAKALADYLGNGDIAYYTDPNQQPSEGRWVYMGLFDLSPVCGGDFTEADSAKMVEFYAVNGWEAWAEAHSVTPAKKYAKYRFRFNSDSFEMTKMIRGGGEGGALAEAPHLNTYTFDTLQDLTTGTELIEEHQFAYPGGAAAPATDCGVLTTTFTRR